MILYMAYNLSPELIGIHLTGKRPSIKENRPQTPPPSSRPKITRVVKMQQLFQLLKTWKEPFQPIEIKEEKQCLLNKKRPWTKGIKTFWVWFIA